MYMYRILFLNDLVRLREAWLLNQLRSKQLLRRWNYESTKSSGAITRSIRHILVRTNLQLVYIYEHPCRTLHGERKSMFSKANISDRTPPPDIPTDELMEDVCGQRLLGLIAGCFSGRYMKDNVFIYSLRIIYLITSM